MRDFVFIGIVVVLVVAIILATYQGSVDLGLYASYILMVLAAGAAIVLPLMNIVQSPGQLKKGLIALVAIVVLFGISYALTGSEVTADLAAKGITESTVKMVGAGLTMFYLVAGIAIIGLIISEIKNAFK
ncbi:MAG: hypothetical protein MUE95_15100 [Cyclobacteriaceae bacterium]|jgi:hypothetical protein|nr:hypothetical protein [Cyclobacteriaceae bacterium]